ncbi:hypothetical protein DFAR_3200015 [Desulfarculales bacterium]
MVMATAMVYPDKKFSRIKPKSMVKRMKDKAFAPRPSTADISFCASSWASS